MKVVKAIQNGALKLFNSLGKMKVKGLPRGVVIALMCLIIGCVVLYMSGWCYIWAVTRRPDLPAMNALITTLTSASFIAAVGFIVKALVDEDDDSIPDYLQKENKEGESNENIFESGPRSGHRQRRGEP